MFTEYELKEIEDFELQHSDCYKDTDKAIGFTIRQKWDSGIGISTLIRCDCCGQVRDITDYEAW